MDEAKRDEIERLMAKGLDLYALGEDERAIECWQQVLALDPEHADAQDFLRSAQDEPEPEPEPEPEAASQAETEARTLAHEAATLLAAGNAGEALELLETVARQAESGLEVEAWIDAARTRLYREYQRRLCEGIAMPQLKATPDEIVKFNLPARAGFVLSRIDGSTSVDEIVELAGGDPFETLRICCRLLDAGIVEVHP